MDGTEPRAGHNCEIFLLLPIARFILPILYHVAQIRSPFPYLVLAPFIKHMALLLNSQFYSIDLISVFMSVSYCFVYHSFAWSFDIHRCVSSNLILLFQTCFGCPVVVVVAKSLQSCPTLCDPIDGSPPGSPVPGILQARTLEWGAISFSKCIKVKSESEVAQSCPTLRNPMDCSLPGSSVHGIFQARVLEWGAIAFSVAILGPLQLH